MVGSDLGAGTRAVLIGVITTVCGSLLVMVVAQFASHATDDDLRAVEQRTNDKISRNTERFETHIDAANIEWRKQAAFRGAVIDRLNLKVSATETLIDDLPDTAAIFPTDEEVTNQ